MLESRLVGRYLGRADSNVMKQALNIAYVLRGRPLGVLFHSDQCSHYTSISFRQNLWRLQLRQSMSHRGNCWDSAPMEQFFRSLKSEWVPTKGCSNFNEAQVSITQSIVGYYSQHSPHQHNGGLPQNKAEARYLLYRSQIYLTTTLPAALALTETYILTFMALANPMTARF